MNTFLYVLHILVCFVLILVVLLQRGKGSDMGAALGGGGSNTVFGSRGAGNFLTKLTTGSAIVFMLTSLSLSYLTNRDTTLLDFGDEIKEPLLPEGAVSPDTLKEIDVDSTGSEDASADELVEIEPSGEPVDSN